MKKVMLCVLAAAIAVSSFAGCGKKAVNGSKVKTVTVWSGNSSSQDIDIKLINEWNETTGKEKGIYIDYTVKGGDTINQEVELALQNGDAPDMFPASYLQKFVEAGYLAPITDLPGGEEFVKQYDGYLRIRDNVIGGKVYRVPVNGGTQGLIYNKDMFKAAGIVDKNGEAKPPKTWDEVVEYAKKLTNKSKQQFGIIVPLKWNGWAVSDIQCPMMSSVGHFGYDPVKNDYDYSGLIPIMHAFLDMKKDGSIYPGAEGLENDSARAIFASGCIGMKFGFSFDVGVLNDQFPAECDWGVAPYPLTDKNVAYKQRMAYGSSFSINKKSLDTVGGEALMEVLKFFTSDDYIRRSGSYPYRLKDGEKFETTPENAKKKGWQEFADLTSISSPEPIEPKIDRGSDANLSTRIVEEVWTGKKTPEKVVEEYKQAMRNARKRYYDSHPDEDYNEAYNPDWNIRLK